MSDGVMGRLRRHWRRRRMRLCFETLRPTAGCRILDVGGTPDFWPDTTPFDVTLLNLPAELARQYGDARFRAIPGDICRLPRIAEQYDLVLSNSVLEHVGSCRRQRQYAEAVRRAPAYWVQVPAPGFPIEVHCRVPFWWLLPFRVRRRLIAGWKRRGQIFRARQMAGTRPLGKRRLRQLFPDAEIRTERFLGLAKSYYVWRDDSAR